MASITLRELGEILNTRDDGVIKNLIQYPDSIDRGRSFLYRLQSQTGGQPSKGMFSINERTISTTTVLQVSIDDCNYASRLQPVKPGSIIILTSKINTYTKFIFKITSIFPFYIYGNEVGGFTFTVKYLFGSSYPSLQTFEEFYIELSTVE
jgi:hypothetical protein